MVDLELKFPDGFFDEEVRDGFTVTRERKEIWAVELDLLNKLQEVCKKHNLQYYLDSGSLLGAVRSNGMIPWDNDIDIVMPRKDYDLLIHDCNSEFKEPYFLQSFYSDKEYYRGHAQLRNSNTSGILMREYKNVSFNQGIFLDIFVLDDIPDDDEKEKELRKKLENYYAVIQKEQGVGLPCKNLAKKLYRYSRGKLLQIIYGDERKIYPKIESDLRACKDNKYTDKLFFRLNSKSSWKKISKSDYSDKIECQFEFLRCPIPAGYEDVLTIYYGKNYMIPRQDPNMHDTSGVIWDTGKSYKEYINEQG